MDEMLLNEAEMDEVTDAVILALGEIIQAEEERTAIIDPQRLAQMKRCYGLLQKLSASPGISLRYCLHEPFKSMGSIILEADKLIFKEPELLRQASLLASNMECYPLVNGKVRMAFTFHGLTIPIE